MLFGISGTELMVILVITLVLVGPTSCPTTHARPDDLSIACAYAAKR